MLCPIPFFEENSLFFASQIAFRATSRTVGTAVRDYLRLYGAAAFLCHVLCLCAALLVIAPARAMADEPVRGRASWYGMSSHGKQTANGEIYNRNALTAAHRQLPFGSVVRVRNLNNGKQVLVRINDRGPFIDGRVVDVSRRAADLLRMTNAGVIPVSIEMVGNVKGEPLKKGHAFFVHIADGAGAMKTRERMTALGNRLQIPLRAIPHQQNGKQAFAICSGPYPTFQKAQRAFLALEKKNFGLKGIMSSSITESDSVLRITEAYESAMAANGMAHAGDSFFKNNDPRALLKNSFHMLPNLSLHSRLVTFLLVQNALSSLSESISFFTLPYQGHSGYMYLPS